MIVTDKFVFLHFPKTGGTFVRTVLNEVCRDGRLYLDDRHLPKHGGVKDIPDRYRDRLILSIVRHPFDHLVSFFAFEWWKTHPDDTFCFEKMKRVYPNFPEISFRDYLLAMYDFSLLHPSWMSAEHARALASVGLGPLTFDFINFYATDPSHVMEGLDRFDSDQFCRMLDPIHFLRTDTLAGDVHRFLKRIGIPEKKLQFIWSLRKIVPDGGGTRDPSKPWQAYYSQNLQRLVRERERMIFFWLERFEGRRAEMTF